MFAWTEERIEFVLAAWAEGKSAGVIAAEIGTTRNTVVGKLHRERIRRGLFVARPKSGTVLPKRPPSPRAVPTLAMVPAIAVPDDEPSPVIVPDVAGGAPCSIIDVTGCKWPVEAAPHMPGGHLFCNAARPLNQSYCAAHQARAVGGQLPISEDDRTIIQSHWNDGHGLEVIAIKLRRPKQVIAVVARHMGLRKAG